MAERRDILAVQTLRNWMMASSLLVSTAILITVGILNIVLRPGGYQEIAHALNITGTRSETLWVIKLMFMTVESRTSKSYDPTNLA
jgi:hypothetical protein